MKLQRAARGGILFVSVVSCVPAAAQQASSLNLSLAEDDHSPATALVPVAGTLIAVRNGSASPNAAEPANKLDMVFDATIWSNKAVLRWLAAGAQNASAVFTVVNARHAPVTYKLTGISLRSLTISAQNGEGQASFILGAAHLSVNEVIID